MTDIELLHWPDRELLARKQRWRRTRDLLERSLAEAAAEMGRSRNRTAVATPLAGLVNALAARLGPHVRAVDHAGPSGRPVQHESCHLVALTHPELLPLSERMELLRRLIRALRPAGRLVVVANVVGHDDRRSDGTRITVPTCTGLLEQLEAASGQGLAIEDLEAVRWGDEPIHRGVLLAMTRISTPVSW